MLVQEDANLAGSFRFVSVANLARISSLEIVRWSLESLSPRCTMGLTQARAQSRHKSCHLVGALGFRRCALWL